MGMVEFLEPLGLGVRVEPGYPLRSIGGKVKTFTTLDLHLIPSSMMNRHNAIDSTTLRELKEGGKGEMQEMEENGSGSGTSNGIDVDRPKARSVTPTDEEISGVLQRGTLEELTKQLNTFPWTTPETAPEDQQER
jgi:hypothetical protein